MVSNLKWFSHDLYLIVRVRSCASWDVTGFAFVFSYAIIHVLLDSSQKSRGLNTRPTRDKLFKNIFNYLIRSFHRSFSRVDICVLRYNSTLVSVADSFSKGVSLMNFILWKISFKWVSPRLISATNFDQNHSLIFYVPCRSLSTFQCFQKLSFRFQGTHRRKSQSETILSV